jgi:hypothetical protein
LRPKLESTPITLIEASRTYNMHLDKTRNS